MNPRTLNLGTTNSRDPAPANPLHDGAPTSMTGRRFRWSRAAPRNPRGDGDRFVQVPRVDHVVAAELFLRLGERTVGHQLFVVPDLRLVAVAIGCSGAPEM